MKYAQLITEDYALKVGDNELVKHFYEHGKLYGNLIEDQMFFEEFTALLEDDDFDPFGYLVSKEKIDVEKDCVLTFGTSNEKMKKMNVVYFSLPAGYSCPFASICKSKASKTGKPFKSGKHIQDFGDIRCYAASAEVRYPTVRKQRWSNFELLKKEKTAKGMADLILRSMNFHEDNNPNIKLFRIHESGDFFSQEYFDAWVQVAQTRSDVVFYAYTKSLPYWQNRKDEIPSNLRLIASSGGKADEIMDKEGFRKAVIVKDKGEAIEKKLHIDVTDFLAAFGDDDFALLLHGTQKAGTEEGKKSYENAKLIKKMGKEFHVPPETVKSLIKYYTS